MPDSATPPSMPSPTVNDAAAHPVLADQGLFTVEMPPLCRIEKLENKLAVNVAGKRRYAAGDLHVDAVLMRHGKRQVLTKRLLLRARTADEFIEAVQPRQEFTDLPALHLVPADAEQALGTRVHKNNAFVQADNDERGR